MPSLTNVTFPHNEYGNLKKATEHYRFESLSAFFRMAGIILIEHYKRGDSLESPLRFSKAKRAKK